MAERNAMKPRTCRMCGAVLTMTARGIQAHAQTCKPAVTK